MAIYNEAFVTINLNELVECRANVIKEDLDKHEVHTLASELQQTLTWSTLFHMVDTHILNYKGKGPVKYGSIANDAELNKRLKAQAEFKKNFDMVKLESSSWTIEVPVRKK